MRKRYPARPEVKRNSDTRLAPPLSRRALVASEAPASPLRQTTWQRRAQWLRYHPIVVFMETAGLIGLIFAVGFFFYELNERQDERIARSWQLLTTPAPGNSGKREALEYLNSRSMCISIIDWCWKERTPLTGIDLSRDTHRGRVFLEEVDLSGADLSGSKFDGALLKRANLSGADLSRVTANGTNFAKANLSRSTIEWANLEGSNFAGADLTNANFAGTDPTITVPQITKLSGSDFTGANLTGANLQSVEAKLAAFTNAALTRIEATYANFEGSLFANAKMNESIFKHTNFTNAHILNADLGNSKLEYANISGANLNPNGDEIIYLALGWDEDTFFGGVTGGSASEGGGSGSGEIGGGDHPPPQPKQFRTTFPELDQEYTWSRAWTYLDNLPTGLPLPLMMKLRFEHPRHRDWPEDLVGDKFKMLSFKNPINPVLLRYEPNAALPNDVGPCEPWQYQCNNQD